MIKSIAIAILLAACGDNIRIPELDALVWQPFQPAEVFPGPQDDKTPDELEIDAGAVALTDAQELAPLEGTPKCCVGALAGQVSHDCGVPAGKCARMICAVGIIDACNY